MTRWLMAAFAALALAGCGSSAAEESKRHEEASFQVCVEAKLKHETYEQCEHMPPGEKVAVENAAREKLERQ